MATVTATVKKVNSAMLKTNIPSITAKNLAEIFIYTSVLTVIGVFVSKRIDERMPKASTTKPIWQTSLEVAAQVGVNGILLYIMKEVVSWGSKKIHIMGNDSYTYGMVVMGVCMLNVQNNLMEKMKSF